MDATARAQVRQALEAVEGTARKAVLEGKSALYSEYSPLGLFHASILVKGAVRLFETKMEALIVALTDDVSAISKDIEAFAMIADCLTRFDRFLVTELDEIILKASGGKKTDGSVQRTAKAKFVEAQARWRRQLEIHRFSFVGMPVSRPLELTGASTAAPYATKNRGGKPLAAHWDAMWADIAFQLWNGDLQPTKQADITTAMFASLNAMEVDAGQTAVTERARAIWQRIEATRLS